MENFTELNNFPQNPRKHRRLDDEPTDTDNPRGTDPTVPLTNAAPSEQRIPSYRDKLTGTSRMPAEEEEILDEDDFEILEGDVKRSVVDGIINIDFSTRVQDLAVKSLDRTIVVKLLGRRIGFNTLRGKLYELWKPSQPFRLMDIENDYFLVTFKAHSDFLNAIAGGPWTIL
ncbi:hypothetical protein V6N11_068023 [Hibiscus sabdariffa]|uniref:DUF4283 domain-containing protein n=1 Tax=Hibiscus sabdariffa TaxID=183260 RepID=A0ABR2SSG1_9ROSI